MKPKSEKRQRGVVVSVRLTGAELAEIQAAAHARGYLISTYLREIALASARPQTLTVTFPAEKETR